MVRTEYSTYSEEYDGWYVLTTVCIVRSTMVRTEYSTYSKEYEGTYWLHYVLSLESNSRSINILSNCDLIWNRKLLVIKIYGELSLIYNILSLIYNYNLHTFLSFIFFVLSLLFLFLWINLPCLLIVRYLSISHLKLIPICFIKSPILSVFHLILGTFTEGATFSFHSLPLSILLSMYIYHLTEPLVIFPCRKTFVYFLP